MITVKRDGYIVEMYSTTNDGIEYMNINVYKPRWIFGKRFMLNVYVRRIPDMKLKDYVTFAIADVEDLYG
jgi:hypothetical protein